MNLEELAARFPDVKQRKDQFRARCPAHGGKSKESLAIAIGENGRPILHCHAGCEAEAVLSAVGLTFKDLGGETTRRESPAATYTYRDENGVPIMRVIRELGKKFWQQAADGTPGVKGLKKVPYHLPQLRAAIARGETIFVVEGEKDVENLERLGLAATCNAGGATKWGPEHNEYLKDAARVVVIADKDAPGRKHAMIVASLLNGTPKTVAEVHEGKDASDWIEMGATAEDFRNLFVARGKAEDTPPKGPPQFEFMTPRQMQEESAKDIKPRALYLIDGCITELDGYLKLGGKTTMALAMVRAITTGGEFLGYPTRQGKVLYLNESAYPSFLEALANAQLMDDENLEVLNFHKTFGHDWAIKIEACIARANETKAAVLVVDTFGQWANIRGDQENSSGTMMEAIEPLQRAAAAGLAVVIIRHTRKSGGGVGVSGRGSTAVSGAVDIIVEIAREEGNTNKNQRLISYVGRFGGFPDEIVAEWDEQRAVYRAVGSVREARGARIEAEILRALARDTMSLPDLCSVLKSSDGKGFRRTDVISALKHLTDGGYVRVSGSGKRGDPKAFTGLQAGDRAPQHEVPVGSERLFSESQFTEAKEVDIRD